MALEIIREAPKADSFTSLTAHQSQTPESFFSGQPVLHYENHDARAVLPKGKLSAFPIASDSSDGAHSTGVNGHTAEEEVPSPQVAIPGIDVWVTSSRLILFNTSQSVGVSLTYPSITLHAIQRLPIPDAGPEEHQGIYMQITSSGSNDDTEFEDEGSDNTLEVTVIPSSATPSSSTPSEPSTTQEDTLSPIQTFFAALSTCSNLHPDPFNPDTTSSPSSPSGNPIVFEGSVGYESGLVMPGNNTGDGELPPPFPGSGGWITAENVGDYFDEEGNWRNQSGPESGLGPGAGNVRAREDGEGEEELLDGGNEIAEAGDGSEETKWRRTD